MEPETASNGAGPASGEEIKQEDDDRRHQEDMDEAAYNVETKSE